MIRKILPLYLFINTLLVSQTHFTIPQNVWRISINNENSTGKWKGHDGQNGWKDYIYRLDSTDYSITQEWKRNVTSQTYLIEYGFTDKATFILNIPRLKKFEQIHSWTIANDTTQSSLDQLMGQYYPTTKSNYGMGNVTMGMKILLLGNPAWRGGQNKYSFYGGIDVTLPFGEKREKYNANDVDDTGMPNQFKQLPIGSGVTQWQIKAFGELYRKVWGRLININWSVNLSTFSREIINPSISFLWIENASADSISRAIGDAVLYEQGGQIFGAIHGQIELWPKRLFLTTGMDWMFSGRDQYFSKSETWDIWMVKHSNYDTRQTLSTQSLKINFLNVDPFLQIGPVPFEMEIGVRWFVPYLTYHTYGNTSAWIRISSYFQAW